MKSLINIILGKYDNNVLVKHNATTLLLTTMVTAVFGVGYAILSHLIDFQEGSMVMASQAVIYFLFPILFIVGLHLNIIGNLYIFVGLISEAVVVWFTGGLYSPVIPWIGSVPMAALLLINKKSAWTWCLITVGFIVMYGVFAIQGKSLPITYNQEYRDLFFIFCYTGLALIIFVIAVVFEDQKSQAQRSSDSLLENILPKSTAEELKANGTSEARFHDQVTVLFADIIDFTKHTEKLGPRELVAELDYCYKKFDEIVTRNNVEKIKVIGDAYMCAGGLPQNNETHFHDVIKVAFEINDFLLQYKTERKALGKEYFELRIGIHTGSVVAGIVGSKKFTYDIWGNTVNVAARMESSGERGKVNISEKTYELVKDQYNCTPRGKISAKNIGEVDMYFVEGEKVPA